jgi:AAA ATPase domain
LIRTVAMDQEALLKDIFNSFDPFQALPANDPRYVDCGAVRGDADITSTLGRKLLRANSNMCQLYGGHRGSGKSTELLRLKAHLEQKNCWVVYFAAEENDIEPSDTEYTDIIVAITKHILAEVKGANSTALQKWISDRWADLSGIFQQDFELEKVTAEAKLADFGKITTTMKSSPNQRKQIREKLEPHTQSLCDALNEQIDLKLVSRKMEMELVELKQQRY